MEAELVALVLGSGGEAAAAELQNANKERVQRSRAKREDEKMGMGGSHTSGDCANCAWMTRDDDDRDDWASFGSHLLRVSIVVDRRRARDLSQSRRHRLEPHLASIPLSARGVYALGMGKDEEPSFGSKLSRGAASALLVSLPLAMGVTVFDRSVIQFANGTAPSLSRALSKGFLNVLKSPIACALGKDNLAVFAVYGSTYIGKNSAEIAAEEFHLDKFWTVFFVSTIVNSSMGILKDRFLATMFGKGPATFPLNSYINFIARDSVIVGASFNGPLLVSPWLQRNFSGASKDSCDVVAQLACPAAAQIVGTPIHMLGLDFYNRPQASLATRILDAVKSSYAPIGVRMVRQCFVFGFGSIAVKYVNKKFQGDKQQH